MYEYGFVLAGGGSKGACQVGMLEVLREHGIQPDIISGISVGALNGAMLAQGRWDELQGLWDRITRDDIYTGGIGIRSVFNLLTGRSRALFDHSPLRKLVDEYVDPNRLDTRLLVGAVPLSNGEYFCWDSHVNPRDMMKDMIVASATLPVFFEPIASLGGRSDWVDGGVAVQSPLHDIAKFRCKKIIILHANPEKLEEVDKLGRVHNVAARSFEVMMYHSLQKDIRETKRINKIVDQAHRVRPFLTLTKSDGQPYKKFDLVEIFPKFDNKPGVIDFNRNTLDRMKQAGREAAERMLPSILGNE
jgi:NTE family protein